MSKERIIQDIENLFPIDSKFEDTNKIGKELIIQAIESTNFNWRDLPIEVLQQYRVLCIWKENEQIRQTELKRAWE